MCAAETPRLNSLNFSQQVMVRIITVVMLSLPGSVQLLYRRGAPGLI